MIPAAPMFRTFRISHRISHRNPIAADFAWLYVGLGLVLLPHVAYQTPSITSVCIALFTWRVIYDFGWVPLPSKLVRMIIALGALLTVATMYKSVLGRDPGVSLLLMMICLKLLEVRTDRDFMIIVCLGYFGVIAGFLYNQTMLIGVYLLLAVVLLTTALISHNSIRTTSTPRREKECLRLGFTLLVQSIPLALILFALFPRVQDAAWGLAQNSAGAKTGLTDQMSPGKISNLSDNDETAFRVEFDGTNPFPWQLYWRGPVLNTYDGRTWTQTNNINIKLDHNQLPVTSGSQPLSYRITLEPHKLTWLFALDVPVNIPKNSYLNGEFELRAPKPVVHLAQYHIESALEYTLSKQSLINRHTYLQLPSGYGVKAQALSNQMAAQINGSHRDAALVQAVINYFKQQPFFYTRNAPLLDDDPIDEFLFSSRRGFCEHYASAFVFLMRASGIPARVVTGYQGGEYNPMGNYFLIKQSDAHAWAEVWLENQGWTRVDPTAAIPAHRIEDRRSLERRQRADGLAIQGPGWFAGLVKNIGLALDNADLYWNKWFIGYNGDLQQALLAWIGLKNVSQQTLVTLLFCALGLSLALIAMFIFYRSNRQYDPAQRIYDRLCRKLRRHGIEKQASEGALTFAARVGKVKPQWQEGLQYVGEIYNNIRYGNMGNSKTELTKLRRAVNDLKL